MLRKRFTRRKAKKTYSDINMTPILDMTFLLLIAFIITFPALQSGITVNLPKGTTAPLPISDKSDPLTITVKDGQFYVGKDPYIDEALEQLVKEKSVADPELRVHLRADESQIYGRVIDVMKILQRHKIQKISFVTEND